MQKCKSKCQPLALFSLFVSPFAVANETIEHVLLDSEYEVEFEAVGSVYTFGGDELKNLIDQMQRLNQLAAYGSTDHESKNGIILTSMVPLLFMPSEGPTDPCQDSEPAKSCDGVIYPLNPNNQAIMELIHSIKHQNNIVLVKEFALRSCNQTVFSVIWNTGNMAVPVYTAPTHLVNILYNDDFTQPYHLSDGLTFHCKRTVFTTLSSP